MSVASGRRVTRGNQQSRGLSTGFIPILKLHGSLSWLQLSKEKADDNSNAYVELSPSDSLYHTTAHSPLSLNELSSVSPYVVPPIWQKKSFETSFLHDVWYDASIALIQAVEDAKGKIIVIGYSLPTEDLHARALLRGIANFSTRKGPLVHLIDPNPTVAERFYAMVTENIKYYQRRFTGEEITDILQDP